MLASGQMCPCHSIVCTLSRNVKALLLPLPPHFLNYFASPLHPWQELKVKLHKNLAFPSVVDCKLRGILVINLDHLNEFPVIFWKESVIKKSAAGPQAYRSNSSKMDLFPRHFWCATECEVDTSIVAVPSKSSLFYIIFLFQFQSTRAKSCQKAQLLFENMFQGMASTTIKLSV